jgi:hypothetical protein
METAQQHEWGNINSQDKVCKHCACFRWVEYIDEDDKEIVVYQTGAKFFDDEPPCITRTKQQEDD